MSTLKLSQEYTMHIGIYNTATNHAHTQTRSQTVPTKVPLNPMIHTKNQYFALYMIMYPYIGSQK